MISVAEHVAHSFTHLRARVPPAIFDRNTFLLLLYVHGLKNLHVCVFLNFFF